ncbi:MAG: DNA polymerase II large subunit [Candidatus Pacearchaeota archaeon]
MQTEKYFYFLEKEIQKNYSIAEMARAKGIDFVKKVEVPLAHNLAEKSVRLISTLYPQINDIKIIKRIIELENQFGSLSVSVSLKIAEEISKEKFCKFSSHLEAIEAGIRVGFAYTTLGVVSSPIEGFTHLKIKKRMDGKDYFAPYFSGPIRSAGTTASCVVLFIIDYLREIFGYYPYDPSEEEIKRTITEIYDFHERATNLQYLPTEEEAEFLARNVPVQISGEPSERFEVSNYKDLPRVDTNFVRGGFCLVYGEGLAQKAKKALRILLNLRKDGFKLTEWDFLKKYCEIHEKSSSGEKDITPIFLKDLPAGRPVFSHPSRSGGLRFRYGRSRVSGFSSVSIHPATMAISNNFLAIGTQLKLEKPTKGCVISVCDSIEGPIVKLKNGNVKKIYGIDEALGLYKDIEEIIYLGDILFPFGDVLNRNSYLLKPGYVEEWWNLELEKHGKKIQDYFNVPLNEALNISKELNIPLHPKYIYFWSQITYEQFLEFLRWMSYARLNNKVILPWGHIEKDKFSVGKRTIEILGIEHQVSTENVVISEIESKALFANLGISLDLFLQDNLFVEKEINFIIQKVLNSNKKSVLEIINLISNFIIKDKAGDFIGCRMGRPEKAKLRKLTGSPHVLFPVSDEGGRFRSIIEASNIGFVNSDFSIFSCEKCTNETIYPICEKCGNETQKRYYCHGCGKIVNRSECMVHGKCKGHYKRRVDIKKYLDEAYKIVGLDNDIPTLVKGVRGMSSEEHVVENLVKGVLRAKFNLNVNKDGTVRYDMTELPITHFKPKEIFISIDKIKELGYTKDVFGEPLVNEDQIIELMPHDIILPCSSESGDERADEVFINLANFIDTLLEKLYRLERFYKIKKRDDLIGHLAVCMAPHNCAGVISRIIGFSKTQGLLASPYMHAAMRRDCDGDEAAVMLLLDVLINFSKKYLPSHRGGTQDAPLVLNGKIVAGEVDDQILDFEIVNKYPLELYEKAENRMHSSEVKNIETIRDRLHSNKDVFKNIGFTHSTSDFNAGVLCSSYKRFPTMTEKVNKEMELVLKLRAVDTSDVARLIIERHFIRDIRGNLRKFSMQGFRCVKCNNKFRRPPLQGNCVKCGGKIIFTISEGGIVKYLEPALELANRYDIPIYVKQNLELTKKYIESIFGREETKQTNLEQWFD